MMRLFQFLAVAVVAALIYIAHAQKTHTDARAKRVQELAECFHQEDFHLHAPPTAAQKAFLRAIYVLHQNLAHEGKPKMWEETSHDIHWYLDEALKDFPAETKELSLIKSSLIEAHAEAQRLGLLRDPDSRQTLANGNSPLITNGTFEGEPVRVGWKLSPVLIPQTVNHMANFILQPAMAWGLQHDRMDDASFATAKNFYAAGILNDESFGLAQTYHQASRSPK